MGSPNGSNDTTHTPPPLSFYNTFKANSASIYGRITNNVQVFRKKHFTGGCAGLIAYALLTIYIT
jgi:hypothetical protein